MKVISWITLDIYSEKASFYSSLIVYDRLLEKAIPSHYF